jgi:hypothetical protein
MRFRAYFLLVTAFFVTMNVLLWRAEFGGRGHLGTPVPASLVWEKVLTSPDNSWLEIRHHGVKIGRAHWAAGIVEQLAEDAGLFEDLEPEGMVRRVTGYTLDFDGSVSLDDLTRVRFNFNLKLKTNQNWREFSLKLTVKPLTWEIRSSSESGSVRFIIEEEMERTERIFSFADLRNPDKILRELGGPVLPATLGAFGIPMSQPAGKSMSPALIWEARNDRLKIGSNLVRVYRLEAQLFDRFKATLFVSPVGEILRMELPDEIILTNDALTTL